MIDEFDYKEPLCPLSGGKEFYYPEPNAPKGRIPVARILNRVDALFSENDYKEAGRLLLYWKDEAISLCDKSGELSMESELVGYYRKQGDRECGLTSIARALALVKELDQGALASGATVLINCATAYKAFGMAEEALPLYTRAEETYQKLLPAGDVRFGGLYNNMALALTDLSFFPEAETAYRRALSVMECIPGGEAESAITYINLAHLYEAWGRPEEIPASMERAYALLKSEELPHNGYYAFVLEKCAPSFGYFGNRAAYEEFKKEAARIYEGA